MLATKIRTAGGRSLMLAMAVLLTACAPPGARALLKGKKLLDAGNCGAAMQELKSATALMPTNAIAWNYLGLAYHCAGQGTNAAAAYLHALYLNRELLEARFNLGCLSLEQDRFEAAKSEFTAYTLRRGNVPEGWLKLGLTQLRLTNSLAAEKSFREAALLDPKSAEALNGLGLAQRQHGRSTEAAQSFGAALRQQSDYRPALLNLATVLLRDLNNPSEALRRYREYLDLKPRATDWEAVNLLVQSLTPTPVIPPRPATNSIARLASATIGTKPSSVIASRSPTMPKSEIPQSVAKSTSAPVTIASPPPVAVAKFAPDSLVKIATNNSSAPVAVTPAPVATNLNRRSTPEPREFISMKPPLKQPAKPAADETNGSALVTNTLARLSAVESLPTAGGRYVYQSPPTPEAGDRIAAERALLSGRQAQNIGRLSEAMQAYRRAGQLDGSYFEAHYLLGLAALEARSFRLALSAWETALVLRPDSADARYNFALTLKAANYPNDAATELEKLLGMHADEARGHLTLGNLYAEQLGDPARARWHYERVLQLDPRNPQAQSIRYWLVAHPN